MYETVSVIVVFVGVLIVFFLLRELWCWYWKLNQIVDNQEKQNKLLLEMAKFLQSIENQNKREGERDNEALS